MARQAPQSKPNVTAAGQPVYNHGPERLSALKPRSGKTAWQEEVWGFYDLVGEYRYAVDFAANLISKARLTVERLNNDGTDYDPVTSGPAHEALMEFYGGPVNHSDFLHAAATNSGVAGEYYIVSWREGGLDQWRVVSRSQISINGKKVTFNGQRHDVDKILVIRQWQPHPNDYDRPVSASQALLSPLTEIYRLSQHIQAQVISRLSSAGMLLVSDQVEVSPPEHLTDQKQIASMSAGDKFTAQLTATMNSAIRDRDSASAVVPIVVTMPDEAIERVRYVTFWTELDENTKQMRDDAIGRLALGLDMPPESLMGNADQNHWQAWLTDESALKAHLQPTLGRITSSLTQGYLHPAIKDEVPDWARYRISADDSGMRIRPNRSKESIELYDRGELSAEAMRRENGFGDKDKMGKDELRDWMVRRVASGSTTPELVEAALEELGVHLDPEVSFSQVTQEARPTRTLKGHEERSFPQDRPEQQRNPDPALLATCDVLTLRALERAGNRIKNLVQTRPEGVRACEYYQFAPTTGKATNLDFLLEDAWTHVPDYAEQFGLDPQGLTEALDAYARQLIVNKAGRDNAMLARYLERVGGQ